MEKLMIDCVNMVLDQLLKDPRLASVSDIINEHRPSEVKNESETN